MRLLHEQHALRTCWNTAQQAQLVTHRMRGISGHINLDHAVLVVGYIEVYVREEGYPAEGLHGAFISQQQLYTLRRSLANQTM